MPFLRKRRFALPTTTNMIAMSKESSNIDAFPDKEPSFFGCMLLGPHADCTENFSDFIDCGYVTVTKLLHESNN